jgi:hypothetical protein
MRELHIRLPKLLNPGGVYSFFNGLCPHNVFFQGVMCQLVQLELQELGFSTQFVPVPVNATPDKDKTWKGVKRKYFYDDRYFLPICHYVPVSKKKEEDESNNEDGRKRKRSDEDMATSKEEGGE